MRNYKNKQSRYQYNSNYISNYLGRQRNYKNKGSFLTCVIKNVGITYPRIFFLTPNYFYFYNPFTGSYSDSIYKTMKFTKR